MRPVLGHRAGTCGGEFRAVRAPLGPPLARDVALPGGRVRAMSHRAGLEIPAQPVARSAALQTAIIANMRLPLRLILPGSE